MRPAKLHELCLPTPTQLWRKYILDTPLDQTITTEVLLRILNEHQAIELVNLKGRTVCKVLNEPKINDLLKTMYYVPPRFYLPQWLYQLVKQAN